MLSNKSGFLYVLAQPGYLLEILIVTFFLCLVFFRGLFPASSCASVIEGIIFSRQGPVQGAEVHVFHDFPTGAAQDNSYISKIGKRPGEYCLELPPGRYFFAVSGKQEYQSLFSYYGGNPVSITKSYYWMPFFTVASISPICKDGSAGISGQVTFRGKPLHKGTVSVYRPENKLFRGMGLFTNTLTLEGRFRFDLEPGMYVVIARQRHGDASMGPLKKGDLFCYPSANPIYVGSLRSCELEIPCYPRDDLHLFLEDAKKDPRGRREAQRRSASLSGTIMYDAGKMPPTDKDRARVVLSGRVTDPAGEPRPGLFVLAYPAENNPLFQMYIVRSITNHIARTDENGSYRIELQAGKYYIVVREKVGEAPDHMEYYGLYEGNANHCITVRPGNVSSEANITVEQIMP